MHCTSDSTHSLYPPLPWIPHLLSRNSQPSCSTPTTLNAHGARRPSPHSSSLSPTRPPPAVPLQQLALLPRPRPRPSPLPTAALSAANRRQQVNKLGTIDLAAIRSHFEKEHPTYAAISRQVEAEYRKFLEIKQQHVDTDGLLFAAPPAIVAFWRTHVLHTASYAAMWQAAGVQLHYEPTLNEVDHESYARRIGNTVALYRALFTMDPREVDEEVWDVAGVVVGDKEGAKKEAETSSAADEPLAITGVDSGAKAEPATNSAAADAQQPAQEPQVPMPEFDPDMLYNSDAADAADQDMSQVWSVTIKAITGKVFEFRFKKDIQVGQLMHLIEKCDGIPLCMQRLIFSGKQLDPMVWLKKDEGVMDGSVMHMVVKLRGC